MLCGFYFLPLLVVVLRYDASVLRVARCCFPCCAALLFVFALLFALCCGAVAVVFGLGYLWIVQLFICSYWVVVTEFDLPSSCF